jgi:aminoglycoside phosphotransferase (APT) family kinase protein
MPVPSRRDYDAVRARLRPWLAERLGVAPTISAIAVPESSGFSSETLLFDAAWADGGEPRSARYVIRMAPAPSDDPVFPTYDLALQHRCLTLVRATTDVPVPYAPWLETDAAVLGSPFFVMERIDGTAPPDMPPYTFGSWITEASEADRQRLERATVSVLARLHAIDVPEEDARALARPTWGRTPLEQHLGYQRWYYDWCRGDLRVPIVERAWEWIDAHRPVDDGAARLNWGDARIGNVLYRDFEPVAVLDWEMAALGAPEVDLGWMLVMHRFFDDLARDLGLPGLPTFFERGRVIQSYETLSGHPVRDLAFYEVFAALRWAIISIKTSQRAVKQGQMPAPDSPDGLIMVRGLLERMLAGDYWD